MIEIVLLGMAVLNLFTAIFIYHTWKMTKINGVNGHAKEKAKDPS
jgi:hypothetical protein